ncbi:MAG: hypothetical protein LUQ38_07990 [Methanotrichaceae archaeon]|nr:hypothetical protein [Methanotrichaceae archaeon]
MNIQSNDVENCGGCGISCNSSQGGYCDNGVCACSDPLLTSCVDAAGDFNCVDIQTDRTNCEGCGKVCAGACVEGTCYPTMLPATAESMSAESPMQERVCPDDYPTICNGECVDTQSDPFNCEKCGLECDRATCVDGSCVLDLKPPTSSMKPSAKRERESRN